MLFCDLPMPANKFDRSCFLNGAQFIGARPEPWLTFSRIEVIMPKIPVSSAPSSQTPTTTTTTTTSPSVPRSNHTRVIKLPDSPSGRCLDCGKHFTDYYNARRHWDLMHSGTAIRPDTMSCRVCGKQFKQRQYLNNHLRLAHNIYQRQGGGGGGSPNSPRPPRTASMPSPQQEQQQPSQQNSQPQQQTQPQPSQIFAQPNIPAFFHPQFPRHPFM